MASFEEGATASKANAATKNSRSPLNDPFYAESLIIQSKSIVGRMYGSNEYVRFKYECELNQLVKEYRMWLAEIKREERDIAAKLDAMRQEQHDISKERRDLQAIQLVAKTNREFINHYKRRGINKRSARSVLQIQPNTDSFSYENKNSLIPASRKVEISTSNSKGSKLQKVLRLPKIVSKVDEVVQKSNKGKRRRTSLPVISTPNDNTRQDTPQSLGREAYEKSSRASRQPEHIQLVQGLLKGHLQGNENTTSQSKKGGHQTASYSVTKSSFDVKSGNGTPSFENDKRERQEQELESLQDEDESEVGLPLDNFVRKPRLLSAPKSRNRDRDVLVMPVRPSSACGTTS